MGVIAWRPWKVELSGGEDIRSNSDSDSDSDSD